MSREIVEKLAEEFHIAYEELAPTFSYKTRKASAVPWKDVPEQNKRLMCAVIEKAMLPKLADERKPMECGHPRACWVELKAEAPDGSMQGYAAECSACAERERVRERCASAAIGVSMAPSEMPNDRLMLAQDVRRRCVETIRQLDLTKDLAPSTEEDGPAPASRSNDRPHN